MESTSHTPKNRPSNVYFTLMGVDRQKVGFTDILMRWSTLYKLGTSLNYTYVHKPIVSQNTNSVYDFLGFNDAFPLQLDRFLNLDRSLQNKAYNLRQVITFSASRKYFSPTKLKNQVSNFIIDRLFFSQYIFIDVVIKEQLFKEFAIDSVDKLQKYIQALVSQYKEKGNKKILVRLELSGARKEFYSLINSEISDLPNNSDLREAYFETRAKQPVKRQFSPDKIKMLVHIRQGDTAFIETPWDTYIPVYGNKSFTELQSPEDGGYADLIDVDDYYQFVAQLTEHFDRQNFSMVVSSDGYGKAFKSLFSNLDKFDFNSEQIQQLKALEKQYDQKYRVFENFSDISFLVGENDDNLYSLIDAVLEADIIILGFRNTLGMLLKIISHYYNLENPPVIIELYKHRKPFDSQKLLGLDSRKANKISTQLGNYDWEYLKILVNSAKKLPRKIST